MQIRFFEDSDARRYLFPLTYTRPIANLRVGILTIAEKWSQHLQQADCHYDTEPYLAELFPGAPPSQDALWIINGILPDENLIQSITRLRQGELLTSNGQLLVAKGCAPEKWDAAKKIEFAAPFNFIERPWDIFQLNGAEIRKDYQLITSGRQSALINDEHTITYGEDIFIEKGVTIKACVLNAEHGPIYIGQDCEIQEGALIRGPFAMGAHSVVNMGAKIKSDTSLGPYCKVGGEVSNCVFWGYSSKGHDGFLGNAVIGEWCNLGADTNNSNLKNNYDLVKMWDYGEQRFINTQLQFCGLIMGDHSKCAINTMFNTGTTVGVAANIYGEGFPRNIVPSFAWGGASGFVTHLLRKAYITADVVMKRRNLVLTDAHKLVLQHIFEQTASYRSWENK